MEIQCKVGGSEIVRKCPPNQSPLSSRPMVPRKRFSRRVVFEMDYSPEVPVLSQSAYTYRSRNPDLIPGVIEGW